MSKPKHLPREMSTELPLSGEYLIKNIYFCRKEIAKNKKYYADCQAVGIVHSGRRHSPALGEPLTPSRPVVTASPVRRRPAYAEGCRRHRVAYADGFPTPRARLWRRRSQALRRRPRHLAVGAAPGRRHLARFL